MDDAISILRAKQNAVNYLNKLKRQLKDQEEIVAALGEIEQRINQVCDSIDKKRIFRHIQDGGEVVQFSPLGGRVSALDKPYNLSGKEIFAAHREVNFEMLKKRLKWPKKDANV